MAGLRKDDPVPTEIKLHQRSRIMEVAFDDGQRFEFTYELSHRMLKRQLELGAANPLEFDVADFHYLIRSGNEQGLLRSAWPAWRRFRELRAKTSHTYDEAVALLAALIRLLALALLAAPVRWPAASSAPRRWR